MKSYRCTVTTSTATTEIVGDSEPQASADDRQRVIWGADDAGRGVAVTVSPLDARTQFVLHSIGITVVPSKAGDDDA